MTNEQLLPVYQQITGQPGSDDAFNHWVQGIIDNSGSQSGTDGIPDDYFNTPTGQAYVQTTTTTPSLPGGTTMGGATQPTLPGGTNPSGDGFQQAPFPANVGGNYNQVQNAVQGGQFGTLGTTTNDQTQTQSQTSQGTSTTTPNDTLGFGALLQGQAGQVGQNDAARSAFLTDLMQNGGTNFQSQLDQGVRNSLTGPQMTGAGDSARARAAGYAGAQIGRTNLDERLNASQQLAAPTGLASLSTAANPYIGQTSSTSGATTGLSDLVSQATEAQSGVSAAQSSQAGSGQIPQGQPVKTGGCVLCTAAIELKLSNHQRVLRRVIRYKLHTDSKRFASAAKGYFAVFTPLAAWLLTHPRLARSLWPVAKVVVYEELRVSGRRLPFRAWPWLVHWTGHTFCSAVGATLPVKGYVDNSTIIDIARKNNILFEVQS